MANREKDPVNLVKECSQKDLENQQDNDFQQYNDDKQQLIQNNNNNTNSQNKNQEQYNYTGMQQKQDQEDYEEFSKSFSDKSIRLNFIKKVYSILSTQILLTAVMIYISCVNWDFALFQLENFYLQILGLITIITIMIMVSCFPDRFARKVPINYILLFIFTFAFAWFTSSYCATVVWMPDGTLIPGGQQLVIIAAFMTAGLTGTLTLYACTTKSDFTILVGCLWTLSFCMLFLLLAVIITGSAELYYFYLIISLMLYSIYLIFDTQLIVGGEGYHFKIGIDDYVFGAIALYTDIIMIFIRILEILQRS